MRLLRWLNSAALRGFRNLQNSISCCCHKATHDLDGVRVAEIVLGPQGRASKDNGDEDDDCSRVLSFLLLSLRYYVDSTLYSYPSQKNRSYFAC